MAWTFDHAPRGGCSPDCPLYGVCHCGCGGRTTRTRENHTPNARREGEPMTFIRYHHNKRQIRYSRCGMDAVWVLPSIEILCRMYTAERVAKMLGYSAPWVSMIRVGKIRRVRLGVAQRIFELVRGTRAEREREEAAIERARYRRRERVA